MTGDCESARCRANLSILFQRMVVKVRFVRLGMYVIFQLEYIKSTFELV